MPDYGFRALFQIYAWLGINSVNSFSAKIKIILIPFPTGTMPAVVASLILFLIVQKSSPNKHISLQIVLTEPESISHYSLRALKITDAVRSWGICRRAWLRSRAIRLCSTALPRPYPYVLICPEGLKIKLEADGGFGVVVSVVCCF